MREYLVDDVLNVLLIRGGLRDQLLRNGLLFRPTRLTFFTKVNSISHCL